MVAAFDAVLAQALKLPDKERRALVAHLLETFEPGCAPVTRPEIASDEMRDELGQALDVGIAELDRGQGIESSIDEFMAEVDAVVGLGP